MHARCPLRRSGPRLELILPVPFAVGATEASAALSDVASLVTSPWGAWTALVLAIVLVIVLLLWHVIDNEPAAPPRGRIESGARRVDRRRSDVERRDTRTRRHDRRAA